MMNYINREKTDFFIRKVFDYYNGRINTCNIARLQIDWVNLEATTNGGLSRNPNLVIMYPLVIGRYTDNEFTFYFVILETVIHELYHQDQMIDYIRMAAGDMDYVRVIEASVEIQTNLYIASHMNEILYNFGLDLSCYSLDLFRSNVERYECGYGYVRRNWFDHILISLREMVYDFEQFMEIRNDLISIYKNNSYNRFVLRVNNDLFYIYNNGLWCDIRALNDFLYAFYYAYTLRTTTVVYMEDDFGPFLYIETDLKQRMCF